MPKIEYQPANFTQKTLATIARANEVLGDFAARGFDLTVRQLYYQFVARQWIENKQKEYKRLGEIVSAARLAGLIDWNHLIDRTRNLASRSHWTTPEDIIHACVESYHEDLWEQQPLYVECWIEKDALVGVLQQACTELDVPYFSCRGYTSQSEMWAAAMRLRRKAKSRPALVIHLGDHDPSGIDMSRDIFARLALLSGGANIKLRRIALNMHQIEELNPPPNPAKVTDSRYADYTAKFGEESWELDALDPDILVSLIQDEIRGEIDRAQWDRDQERIEERREQLAGVERHWPAVVDFIAGLEE